MSDRIWMCCSPSFPHRFQCFFRNHVPPPPKTNFTHLGFELSSLYICIYVFLCIFKCVDACPFFDMWVPPLCWGKVHKAPRSMLCLICSLMVCFVFYDFLSFAMLTLCLPYSGYASYAYVTYIGFTDSRPWEATPGSRIFITDSQNGSRRSSGGRARPGKAPERRRRARRSSERGAGQTPARSPAGGAWGASPRAAPLPRHPMQQAQGSLPARP